VISDSTALIQTIAAMRISVSILVVATFLNVATAGARLRNPKTATDKNQPLKTQEDEQFWDRYLQDGMSIPMMNYGPVLKVTNNCCHPDDFLFCFIGIAKCCENGEWACTSDGAGEIYLCDGEPTTDPNGVVCDEDSQPSTGGIDPAAPTVEGTPVPDTGGGFAGGMNPATPDGPIMDAELANTTTACCHPYDVLFCFIGVAKCCENGEWACTSDAAGEIYMCDGEPTTDPQGAICKDADPQAEPIEGALPGQEPGGGFSHNLHARCAHMS
jgi:hypothetical protein